MNKKTIITVQHTESEHHLNGHAGARGDWALTENGRKQAFEIGRWLLNEGCDDGFVMYCSDQRRAAQTAEEINKVRATENRGTGMTNIRYLQKTVTILITGLFPMRNQTGIFGTG